MNAARATCVGSDRADRAGEKVGEIGAKDGGRACRVGGGLGLGVLDRGVTRRHMANRTQRNGIQ